MEAGFLPFAKPDIGQAEIDAVVDAMKSGWLSSGPNVRAFEAELAEFIGRKNVLLTNSATAAFDVFFECVDYPFGSEIIFPVWTFSSPAMSALHAGYVPVFCDIRPDTLTIDVKDLLGRITDKTKAVVVTHFAGLASDLHVLKAICKERGVDLVEDAAHALPTKYRGTLVGSDPDITTIFSFYATKTITTGEGGALLCDIPHVVEKMRKVAIHGFDRSAFDRYSTLNSWFYDVAEAGFKTNMPDPAAAMGRVQLKRVEEMRFKRSQIAADYVYKLAMDVELPPLPLGGDTHAWHLFVIKVPADVKRDRFIQNMAKLGIGCSVHFIPLHRHSYWREFQNGSFPVADAAFSRVVSLPIFSSMTPCEVLNVIQAVKASLQ
jgi:dTDP-4-amino-4,6-dideoxygalactose transaminase